MSDAPPSQRDEFRVLGLAHFTPEYMDPDAMHQENYWCLTYFYDPGLVNRVGASDAPTRPRPTNEAHLYPPGQRYWEGTTDRAARIAGAWLAFYAVGRPDLQRLVDNPQFYARFADPHHILGRLMAEGARQLRGMSQSDRWFAQQAMLLPILRLLREATHTAPGEYVILSFPPSLRHDLLTSRAHEFIRRHYAESIRLRDIARHLGVSSSHLSHSYAHATGETPAAALHRYRVQMAARLIARGESAKRTALLTGFADLPHLSRSFQRQTGISPSAFARLAQQTRPEHADPTAPDNGWNRNLWRTTIFVSAKLLTRSDLTATHINTQVLWVLDAFLTIGVRFRAGSAQAAWTTDEPGWLRLYPPGCPYSEDGSRAERPIRSLSLCFYASNVSPVLQRFGTAPRVIRFRDPEGTCTELLRRLSGGGTHSWGVEDIRGQPDLHRLLDLVVDATEIGANEYVVGSAGRLPAWVLRVQRFLEQHHAERLQRRDIAHGTGISLSKLDREYASQTGETLMQSRSRLRIQHARRLLKEGLSLAEVAEQTGYDSAESLSRAYKRALGHTPHKYPIAPTGHHM